MGHGLTDAIARRLERGGDGPERIATAIGNMNDLDSARAPTALGDLWWRVVAEDVERPKGTPATRRLYVGSERTWSDRLDFIFDDGVNAAELAQAEALGADVLTTIATAVEAAA